MTANIEKEKQERQFIYKIKEILKKEHGKMINCKFHFENKSELVINGEDAWYALSKLISIFPDKKMTSTIESTTIIITDEDFHKFKEFGKKQPNKVANATTVASPFVISHNVNQKSIYRLNNSRTPVVLSTTALATITMTFSLFSILAHSGYILAAVSIAPYLFASVAVIGAAALLGFLIYYTVTKSLQTYATKNAQSKNNSTLNSKNREEKTQTASWNKEKSYQVSLNF